jgi:hypothetical protein
MDRVEADNSHHVIQEENASLAAALDAALARLLEMEAAHDLAAASDSLTAAARAAAEEELMHARCGRGRAPWSCSLENVCVAA